MMTKKFPTRSIGPATLSFLLLAGCSVETMEEDPGEVASVQEAVCSSDQRVICNIVCRVISNPPPNCVEQCLSGCNQPEPPPTWPWSVGCEAATPTSPLYTSSVSVNGSMQPGSAYPTSTFVSEIWNAAAAPCTTLMRQYYGARCSTLDRSETIYVNVGRTFGGWGPSAIGPHFYGYNWGSIMPVATIPVADLCPDEPPLPPDICRGRLCP